MEFIAVYYYIYRILPLYTYQPSLIGTLSRWLQRGKMLKSKQEESEVIGFFYYVLQNVSEACQKLLSPLLKNTHLVYFWCESWKAAQHSWRTGEEVKQKSGLKNMLRLLNKSVAQTKQNTECNAFVPACLCHYINTVKWNLISPTIMF